MAVTRLTIEKDGKEIIIDIDLETGEIATDTVGYVGVACIEDLNKLLGNLGLTQTSSSDKPERFHQLAQKPAAVVKREQ